ncbi:hypothetical protein [Mycolicibacterium bacteremicum]|nr:hypothetical protein [Mycolicibacterium bacteremicum]
MTANPDEDDQHDPDGDPEMIQPERLQPQPDPAEGADDPDETGEGTGA